MLDDARQRLRFAFALIAAALTAPAHAAADGVTEKAKTGASVPGANVPGANVPGANVPGANVPGATAPRASAREVGAPEAASLLILLIADGSDDRFLDRVGAELAALGFATTKRAIQVPLEQAARELHAVAAVRVLPTRQGVEVWMADQTSGRSLLRQTIVDETNSSPNQSLIAVQTAELLRTSLLSAKPEPEDHLEASPAASASASSPAPTPSASTAPTSPTAPTAPPQPAPTSAPQSEAPPPNSLQAGIGALYSPGGSGAALQLWFSLERSLSAHHALALDVSVPLEGAALSGPEGTAHIATYLAGAVFLLQSERGASPIHYNAGLGLGVLRTSLDADATPPLLARSLTRTTGTGYLRGDLTAEFAPWFRLGARAMGGLSLKRLELRFAENTAGTWGPLYVAAFGLAEVTWR